MQTMSYYKISAFDDIPLHQLHIQTSFKDLLPQTDLILHATVRCKTIPEHPDEGSVLRRDYPSWRRFVGEIEQYAGGAREKLVCLCPLIKHKLLRSSTSGCLSTLTSPILLTSFKGWILVNCWIHILCTFPVKMLGRNSTQELPQLLVCYYSYQVLTIFRIWRCQIAFFCK